MLVLVVLLSIGDAFPRPISVARPPRRSCLREPLQVCSRRLCAFIDEEVNSVDACRIAVATDTPRTAAPVAGRGSDRFVGGSTAPAPMPCQTQATSPPTRRWDVSLRGGRAYVSASNGTVPPAPSNVAEPSNAGTRANAPQSPLFAVPYTQYSSYCPR